jgi:phosphoglucomutase
MQKSYRNRYKIWQKRTKNTRFGTDLCTISGDETAINDAFFRELSFGTGGMRGIIGMGTNCLNVFTIRRATIGLCKYILKGGGKSVCICYDNRINSELFARTTAEICAMHGLRVYISTALAPTPFLSFCVRRYGAHSGVMITASHNPAQYNGYKVYNADGCQITDAAAEKITKFIKRADYFRGKTADTFENYMRTGQIEYINQEAETAYLDAVQNESMGEKIDKNFAVAYSSLHGTGYKFMPNILTRLGITKIYSPIEQMRPDGNFPTCKNPNPEKPDALTEVIKCAKQNKADIAFATDPDADRIGVAINHKNEFVLLSGNEIGVLLCDYILKTGKIKNPIVIKTIVTTTLGDKIAAAYGAQVINTLTGFKYIGEQIGKLEEGGEGAKFALGFEESYGYLKGTYVRDKDAIVGGMLICEMAAYYKKQKKSLVDAIGEIYKKFGEYTHKLLSFEFKGAVGMAHKNRVLKSIRKKSPQKFGGLHVQKITDYLTQTELNLPRADVIQFDLENGNQVIIRPSGTEPLVKIYLTASATKANAETFFQTVEKEFNALKDAL